MQSIIGKIWNLIEAIIKGCLRLAGRLVKKEISEEQYYVIIQFVKFGIIGASNTIISYVLYLLSLVVFKNMNVLPGCDYLVAQVIAFVLSVLWSFYWNNKYVFVAEEGQKRIWWKVLIKTYISYSFTGLFLNSILLLVFVKLLGVSEFIAPVINLVISVPINFIINKFWAYNSK